MQEQQDVEKISILLADSCEILRDEMRLFSQRDDRVEICGIVSTAERVMELLNAGLRPRVLVVDTMLGGHGTLWLLQQVPQVDPDYCPRILLTTPQMDEESHDMLLTLGAHYIIVKPYTMPHLFDTAIQFGTGSEKQRQYLIHKELNKLLCRLQVVTHLCGTAYLEQIVRQLLSSERPCTVGELYHMVAAREHVSCGAVTSGIRRLTDAAHAKQTPAYRQLCRQCGKAEDGHLSNTAFINGITEAIRQTLPR